MYLTLERASRKIIFMLLLLMLFVGVACPQSTKPNVTELKATLSDIIDSAGIPALSIAVIKNGEVVYHDALGIANNKTQQKAHSKTIFQAASLGKPIFAYAVLKYSDEGKFDLDKPLSEYAPQDFIQKHFLKSSLPDEKFNRITARMVLSHSSGLPNWRTPEGIKLLFTPGERYSYSGEGYVYLQTIIEYLSSMPIETWMQKMVFHPLKMYHSSFSYLKKNEDNYALSYDQNGKTDSLLNTEEPNVAHTLRTTASDYALFIIALMNGKDLKEKALHSAFTGQVKTDICGNGNIYWGLGTAVQTTGKNTAFFQWGKSPFASAYVIGFVEQKSAVVYFTNIANQGLRIGEKVVAITTGYKDPLFSCFGVQQYNAVKRQ